MNKRDKAKQQLERIGVEPHGQNKIDEARGKWSPKLTSGGNIEHLKRRTWETITKIRSNTDAAENARRINEEKMKKER